MTDNTNDIKDVVSALFFTGLSFINKMTQKRIQLEIKNLQVGIQQVLVPELGLFLEEKDKTKRIQPWAIPTLHSLFQQDAFQVSHRYQIIYVRARPYDLNVRMELFEFWMYLWLHYDIYVDIPQLFSNLFHDKEPFTFDDYNPNRNDDLMQFLNRVLDIRGKKKLEPVQTILYFQTFPFNSSSCISDLRRRVQKPIVLSRYQSFSLQDNWIEQLADLDQRLTKQTQRLPYSEGKECIVHVHLCQTTDSDHSKTIYNCDFLQTVATALETDYICWIRSYKKGIAMVVSNETQWTKKEELTSLLETKKENKHSDSVHIIFCYNKLDKNLFPEIYRSRCLFLFDRSEYSLLDGVNENPLILENAMHLDSSDLNGVAHRCATEIIRLVKCKSTLIPTIPTQKYRNIILHQIAGKSTLHDQLLLSLVYEAIEMYNRTIDNTVPYLPARLYHLTKTIMAWEKLRDDLYRNHKNNELWIIGPSLPDGVAPVDLIQSISMSLTEASLKVPWGRHGVGASLMISLCSSRVVSKSQLNLRRRESNLISLDVMDDHRILSSFYFRRLFLLIMVNVLNGIVD